MLYSYPVIILAYRSTKHSNMNEGGDVPSATEVRYQHSIILSIFDDKLIKKICLSFQFVESTSMDSLNDDLSGKVSHVSLLNMISE